MAKKQSPKPQGKASTQKKGRKTAEAPQVQVPPATEPPIQPESPAALETPPKAAAPPAPVQPTAEPPAPDAVPGDAATPVEATPDAAAPDGTAPAGTKAKKVKEARPKKTSALDAAAKVLAESGEAMTTQAMIDAMAAKGYWSSPGGATPAATLYSAILRELTTKGEQARFVKTQRGKFGLRSPQ